MRFAALTLPTSSHHAHYYYSPSLPDNLFPQSNVSDWPAETCLLWAISQNSIGTLKTTYTVGALDYHSPASPEPPAILSNQSPFSNETYDTCDPSRGPELRQQAADAAEVPSSSSTASSSTPSSRSSSPSSSPRRRRFAGGTVDTSGHPGSLKRTYPARAEHISSSYSAAILYALEQVLRGPNPFTPDIVEENASMSDIIGGGPSGSVHSRATNNGGTRAQIGPVPVGSPTNAVGIRGPREIMRERNAREAQRKAEHAAKEALEQNRAEEEQRLIDLENRKATERKLTAASSAGNHTATMPASGASEQAYRPETRAGSTSATKPSVFTPMQVAQARAQGRTVAVGEATSNLRTPPEPTMSQSRQPRPQEVSKAPASSRADAGQNVPSASGVSQPQAASSLRKVTRTSFPHAFERWETLSAHWEGLTSYWVRRLEENSSEISREPLSQQMSRQISDLSAAGANLFHAVVELQRLRASSERKFQRWFFETRQQEEKAQERFGMLEKALRDATNSRSKEIEDAVNVAVAAEKEKSTSQKQIAEMRRELSIAREEARRAWEELGRREHEERERTMSLREGQPTLVGGVQVVPMTMGVTSRHSSARDIPPTRDGPPPSSELSRSGQHQYSLGDPFTEPIRPPASSTRPNPSTPHPQYPKASTGQATSSPNPYYQQHQGPVLHTEDPTGRDQYDRSYGLSEPYSEEDYVIENDGQYRRDAQGNKIRFHTDPDSDDARDDTESRGQAHRTQSVQSSPGDQYESTASPGGAPASNMEEEYAGSGFPQDWDAVRTHHHPTRLSDVLEEDERSRTSASRG